MMKHKLTMLATTLSAILLMAVSTSAKITGLQPITAEDYQKIAGRGMAVSWFKTKFSNKSQGDDLKDFRARGFDNVRYRINAHVFSGADFDPMETEINRCISEDLIPIISWINHEAETNASEADKADYVAWWADLARRFKGQHLVAFNLFTEINDGTRIFTKGLYNPWMQEAVDAIRAIDPYRIIILSSPNKTHKQLHLIDPAIYTGDDYMMVEWHLYASGPKKDGGQKNWEGNGSAEDRRNVTEPLDDGVAFTRRTGVECYFGAWMPMDNATGTLNQEEIENFATFFLQACSDRGIPWTVNADQHFYDAKRDNWLGIASTTTSGATLNMTPITDILVSVGDFYEGVDTVLGPQNNPPVFTNSVIALPRATVGTPYTNSIADQATDLEGNALTYSLQDTTTWLNLVPGGVLSGTPGGGDIGTNSWTVQVTDALSGTDSATLEIIVEAPANALIANAGADQTLAANVNGLASVTLDASGSAGTISSYSWLNNGALLGTTENLTLDLPVGTHTITLVVTSNAGFTSDTVVITVTPYVEPLKAITSAGLIVTAGPNGLANVTLDGSASTGDIQSYRWKEEEGTNTIVLGDGALLPYDFAVGVHDIRFRVKNTAGLIDRAQFFLTVVPEPTADLDGDRLPDAWENQYFGNTDFAGPNGDADLDGYSNEQEYIAGSDPTNHASVFMLELDSTAAGAVLSWNSLEGRSYELFHAESLTNSFESIGTVEEGSYTGSVEQTGASGFYRIQVEMK